MLKKYENVLLITSGFEDTALDQVPKVNCLIDSHYPLGLAYLHSFLEKSGYSVDTLFLNNYDIDVSSEMIHNTIKNKNIHCIGFQILTNNRVSSFFLIEKVHELFPEMQILIGGIHTSIMYEQILRKYPYLIAILGEGEETFLDILSSFNTVGGGIDDVQGIAYYRGDSVITTLARDLIPNLDLLPFPKHEIFFYEGKVLGNILTSRGCPFACSFCCLDTIGKRRVRYRSVENVVDEIEYMTKMFPSMKRLWIHDDTFLIKNDRAISICKEIIDRKIKLDFIASGRMKPLSAELVFYLEKAGFSQILFGLESGATDVLEKCKKKITKEDAINAFSLFSKSPIEVTAFLIVGLPGETKATILETAKLIKKLQRIKYTYYNDIGILMVYPGTEVYRIAQNSNMIQDEFWLSENPTPFFTVEHHEQELQCMKGFLLDHIALKRILTINGFLRQFDMIPYIVPYILKTYMRKSILFIRKYGLMLFLKRVLEKI